MLVTAGVRSGSRSGGGAELELPAGQLAAAVDQVQAEQRALLRLKIFVYFIGGFKNIKSLKD